MEQKILFLYFILFVEINALSTENPPPESEGCPVNEIFSEGGPLCEGCGPRCLALSNEAKCYCKPNHSRYQGVCIPDESCPPQPGRRCPVNEVFQNGGPACENCGPRCLVFTYEAKCYCKPGHSRYLGFCIPDESCPPQPGRRCPVNEVFQNGGPLCENCGPRCLVFTYEAKCYCKPGHSRYQGVCIANESCPRGPGRICPVNEVFSRGGPLCENCGPRCLGISHEAKCYCRRGFSRYQGVCIPDESCPRWPANRCPVNEEYGCIDPPGCRTCQYEYPCPTFVCNPGCACKNGFLRYQGICIPKYACPRIWNYYYR